MSGLDPPSTQDNEPSIFRQNLRSRLREKEQKLSDLIRASRNNGRLQGLGSPDPLETNREIIPELRRTTSRFDEQIPRLRETSDDDEIQEKLLGIEQVSTEQSNRIQDLEVELSRKNAEVDELRNDLIRKLERLVSLEIELENRAVAIDPSFDEAVSEMDLGSLSSNFDVARKLSPEQAQVFFSQLLTDLRDLEALYKDERIKSSSLQEQLRLENQFLQNDFARRLDELEARLQTNEEERSQLKVTVEQKDKEIESLKKELADLRLNAISEGNDSLFGEFEADLLRSTPRRSEVDASFPAGEKSLQVQLRDANMRLVRKEQEEAIERAKANFSSQGALLQLALLERAKATTVLEDDDTTLELLDSPVENPVERPSLSPASDSRRAVKLDQEVAIERAKAASKTLGSRSVKDAPERTGVSEDSNPGTSTGIRSEQRSRRAVQKEQDKSIRRARSLFNKLGFRGGREETNSAFAT